MASFVPDINPTSDPNYGGASRGTGDAKANTTVGGLLSGIADVGGSAAKGLYSALNDSLKDDIRSAVEPIRAAHGGDLTPDQIPAISGTGARGSKYAQAIGAGLDPEVSAEEAMPPGMASSLSGLQRMKAAYQQGGLSESKYSSELEVQVQQMRHKWGMAWADEIDQHVAAITGQTPANHLRSSILTDMNSMNAAAGAEGKRRAAETDKYIDSIMLAYPGISRAQAIAGYDKWNGNPEVMALHAQKAQNEFLTARANAISGSNAIKADAHEKVLRAEGARLVSGAISGAINEGNLNIPQIISNGLKDDASLKAVLPQLHLLKARIETAMDQKANFSDPKNPQSEPATKYLKLGEVAKIKAEAVAPVQNVIDLIEKGKTAEAALYANVNKIQTEGDVAALSASPVGKILRTARAVHVMAGDPVTQILAKSVAEEPGLVQQLLTGKFLNILDTKDPKPPATVPEVMKLTQDGKTMPNSSFRKMIENDTTIIRQAKEPIAAERGVHSLYSDMSYFNRMPYRQQLHHFVQTGAKDITEKVATLSPEAQSKYYSAMNTMFVSTFKQGMDNFQSIVTDNNYTVKQDPKTLLFTVTRTTPERPTWAQPGLAAERTVPAANSTEANVQSQVRDLNYGIAMYREVLSKQTPGQELSTLTRIMAVNGVDMSSPKVPSLASRMGEAVKKSLAEGLPSEVGKGDPAQQEFPPLPGLPFGEAERADVNSMSAWLAAHGNSGKGTKQSVNLSDGETIHVEYGPITVTGKDGRKYQVEGTPENIARFHPTSPAGR